MPLVISSVPVLGDAQAQACNSCTYGRLRALCTSRIPALRSLRSSTPSISIPRKSLHRWSDLAAGSQFSREFASQARCLLRPQGSQFTAGKALHCGLLTSFMFCGLSWTWPGGLFAPFF